VCTAAGLTVPPPQAAFYLYPDFEPWRDHLRAQHKVTTGAALARLLLDRYGAAALPASAFGESPAALRLRLATGLLYGRPPSPSPTRSPCPGSPPPWPGCKKYSPTWPAQPYNTSKAGRLRTARRRPRIRQQQALRVILAHRSNSDKTAG